MINTIPFQQDEQQCYGGNTLDTDQSNDCILFRDERAHTNIKQEQTNKEHQQIRKLKTNPSHFEGSFENLRH